MSTQGLRRCCHCGVWFTPHPRKAGRQRFCPKPECRVASKRASQGSWCRKNPSYFRGERSVERVRTWRLAHPNYWKRTRSPPGPPNEGALQDLVIQQPIATEGINTLRDQLIREISLPLQDLMTAQQHTLVGLTSMMTGDALQEDIARTLVACYERGQRIGGMMPWLRPQEFRHERTHTDCSATTAADTATV